MKRKYLSLFLAVCLFSAFPSALDCQCVDADCGSVPKVIQAEAPRCHPAAKGEDPSRKECCGKCQIEKTAVLENKFLSAQDLRFGSTPFEIKFSTGFYSKPERQSFLSGRSLGFPSGFFTQHVLNTTFSFRAPPLSVAL